MILTWWCRCYYEKLRYFKYINWICFYSVCFIYFRYTSMTNNFVSLLPNKHIADIYYQLKKVTLKIQRTASSIGFSNQCVYYNVTPTFAKVRGSFSTIRDKQHVKKKIIKKQLSDHHINLNVIELNILNCQATYCS